MTKKFHLYFIIEELNELNLDYVKKTGAILILRNPEKFKREDIKKTVELIKKDKEKINYKELLHDEKVSKVSIVGAGMIVHPGVTYKMFRSLAENKINILVISTSEIKISVLIHEDMTQKAIKALHKTFNLD